LSINQPRYDKFAACINYPNVCVDSDVLPERGNLSVIYKDRAVFYRGVTYRKNGAGFDRDFLRTERTGGKKR